MSTDTAAGRLSRDTTALVREQARQLTRELANTVREAGTGAVLLAGAGTCALLALATAHQSALRALESVMPRPVAAVTMTAAYGAGAATLAAAGMKKIREAADASGAALAEDRQEAGVPVAGIEVPPNPIS